MQSIQIVDAQRPEPAASEVSGITVGSREQQEAMVRAIETDGFKPVIDRSCFALAEITEAFAYQVSQQHFSKIVLKH